MLFNVCDRGTCGRRVVNEPGMDGDPGFSNREHLSVSGSTAI